MTALDNAAFDGPEPPAVDEAAEAEKARGNAALKIGRNVSHKDTRSDVNLPKIDSPDEAKKLPPGSNFIGPDGQTRTVPYKVSTPQDVNMVPEGADFIGPDGQVRTKPKYEDLDFTSQTLFNMAVNDTERRKALERSYPGKVKQLKGTTDFYVDDDGTMRRPKGFLSAPAAGIAGQVAPVAGSIGGEILGGIGGSAVGPGGTFAGAVGGSAAGGAAGQLFNDAIMQLAGVYDRTRGEEAGELAMAGASGGVGTAAGRMLGRAVGTPQTAKTLLPKAAAEFTGADPEGLKTAISMREKGLELAPPSMWAKEAPHVQNIVEVLDPAFRTQKPLQKAATDYYEQSSKEILDQMGIKVEGKITDPVEAVPTQKAGRQLLLKALDDSFEADLALHNKLQEAKGAAQAVAPGREAAQTSVMTEAREARAAAQRIIDAGYQEIGTSADAALARAGAGHNSGDLWFGVGEQLRNVRQGIMARAENMYSAADQAAGAHLPDVQPVAEQAGMFLQQLPEGFQREYPTIIERIRNIATGDNPPTFGQLRNLRSDLRYNVDWSTLSSDIKNGAFKFFAHRVDEALMSQEAVPELREAARLLDLADDFYKENIPVFNSQNIKAVMKGLEAGEAADPKALYKTIMRVGHNDLNARVLDMIGPNLASGVRAADTRAMLDASPSWIPGQIDGQKFAKEVMQRLEDNMLHSIHGREQGDRILHQAQNFLALKGKIDLPVRPGDTALDIIERARIAGEAEKAVAKQDPLAELNKEMKRITQEHQRELAKMKRGRGQDPLGFLYNPTVGATEAVDRILSKEDLILAAGVKFGEDSPEFNMLRQIHAQRILQGTLEPGKRLEKISPEVQRLMFPGITLDQMRLLAKEMDLLMGAKGMQGGAGKSIMATERVEHPASGFIGGAGKLLPKIPGGDAGMRFVLGKFYKFITDASNNLSVLRFIEKGLTGDAAAQQRAKQIMQRMIQTGGAVGAGAGESEFQAPQ